MKRSRVLAAMAGVAVAAIFSTAALSNGLWSTLPIVGGTSFTCSTVSGTGNLSGPTGQGQGTLGSIAGQTCPAGEAGLTGLETIPLDIFGLNPTVAQSGAPSQTQRVPVGLLAPGVIFQGSYSSYKNLLRNGDISVNPFQSGTTQAADIANTVTTSADGFRMVGGASSAINWSSQTGATDIVADQFTKSLRFQRKASNADTAQICQINVLASADSVALQGQAFVYSFWAKPGANISPSQGNITVKVAWGTGTDQSSANLKAGSWTTYTDAISGGASSTGASNPVAVASGVATVSTLPTGATAGWVQYWVYGSIGATATQVGTEICMTPVGTAGTNDWIETSNHQLEIVGAGVITPSAFEHHTAQQDLAYAQRFLYVLSEVTGPSAVVGCAASSATNCVATVPFPVPMRAIPTMAYANGFATPTTTAGSTLGACTTLRTSTVVTSNGPTPFSVAVDCVATTVPAAGSASTLYNNGGSGKITASSEL